MAKIVVIGRTRPQQKMENVGKVLADVYHGRRVVEATLVAEAGGMVVASAPVTPTTVSPKPTVDGETIDAAVIAYIDDLKMAKRPHKSISSKT